MKPSLHSAARAVASMALLVSVGASLAVAAGSRALPFRGGGPTMTHYQLIMDPSLPQAPVAVQVDIGSACSVSQMRGTVAVLCDTQYNKFPWCPPGVEPLDIAPNTGTGFYSLRDQSGDAVFMELHLVLDRIQQVDPTAPHAFCFSGKFDIVGGTGRFAGASWSGWADVYPELTPPTDQLVGGGPGYWQFCGTIVLPKPNGR